MTYKNVLVEYEILVDRFYKYAYYKKLYRETL